MNVPRLALRRSLARSLRRGHPWVYREALEGLVPAPGTEVAITDGRRVIGRGLTDAGPIGVRMWTVGDEPIDAALFARRVDAATELRRRTMPRKTDAIRLVHGEGDRMPGVVVDLYATHAVLALDGEGALAHRDALLEVLRPRLQELGIQGIVGRWGPRGQRTVEVLEGRPPPEIIEVSEHGMRLCVDLRHGQKTGMFLDQRTSRAMVRRLSRDARVLDLYAYVGGFSVAAGKGGASHVHTVDLAKPAIALAKRAWAANGLPPERHRADASDVPRLLQTLADEHASFDLVVADPPSFAPSADAVPRALAAYEQLHRACLQLLPPGGLLLAASCSSHVDRTAFEDVLMRAADSTHKVLQVVDRWAAPPDHPRLLAFPEGDYLTVTLARIVA